MGMGMGLGMRNRERKGGILDFFLFYSILLYSINSTSSNLFFTFFFHFVN